MWNEITLAAAAARAPNTPGPLGDALKRFAANPKDEEAVKVLAADLNTNPGLRTTCVATMLQGGHAPNALPQRAQATVNCRIFPGTSSESVRQTIGQFLSAYAPAALADGLTDVVVRHGAGRRAEARVLADWSRARLVACGASASLETKVEADSAATADSIEVLYDYSNGQSVRFHGDFAKGHAQLAARIGGSSTELATAISLLSPEAALAEAMFF